VHQFDSRDGTDPNAQAWLPDAGGGEGDIISVSLINRAMHPDPGHNIPIYSFDLGGVIISPWAAQLLCSYPYDVGTVRRKKCTSQNLDMVHCIPGCTPDDSRANRSSDWGSTAIWCPPVDPTATWQSQEKKAEAVKFSGDQGCAWKQDDLMPMMKLRDSYSEHAKFHGKWDDHKFYNELVLDPLAFKELLPHSIEAVFYQPGTTGKDCFDAFNILIKAKMHKCEDYARAAHRAFVNHYGLSDHDVPLLKLAIFNWDAPFSEPLSRPLMPPPTTPSPMPPSAAHPPSPPPPTIHLTHEKCEELMQDKHSPFHLLWGEVGWRKKFDRSGACWNAYPGGSSKFFNDAFNGHSCMSRNWYTGNGGDLGLYGPVLADWNPSGNPHFTANAPALLGFDEEINRMCHTKNQEHATGCTRANFNILSLYGEEIPYNLCRNFEWQLCAAKGTLPGQGSKHITFAGAPKDLLISGWDAKHPLGSCNSYAPRGCGGGYASGDIFFQEVCVYDAICANRDSLWELTPGQLWQCKLDHEGYSSFSRALLR
jgi:hypothetical protein